MTFSCNRPYSRPICLHAAVLAGGRSSRMQTDKRFLRVRGELFIDRALRLARAAIQSCPMGEVFLCGDVPGREGLPDAVLGLGPLSGICSALRKISVDSEREEWLLVLPVDMPLLSEGLIQALVAEVRHEESACVEAIAYAGFEMPCLIPVTSKVRKAIEDLCQSEAPFSSRSIRGLFGKIGLKRLNLPEKSEHLMINANFPSDWAHVSEAHLR